MEYSRVFGSKFPNATLELSNYKDISDAPDNIKELIKQFYLFWDAGNISSACAIVESNWNALKSYYVGTDFLNKIEEEIYNSYIYAMQQNTHTVVSATPPNASDYPKFTTWLKPLD